MEFNQKLQELRNTKGLTQEELAQKLFVSRTAISKWESGRGYPNIDSLKAVAKFFEVTVDQLISGDQLLTIAEEDTKQKERRVRDLVFGLIDVSASMLLFLPFFAQKTDGVIESVSLLLLTSVSPYLKIVYFVFLFLTVVLGVLTLALQNIGLPLWCKIKIKASLSLNIVGSLLLIISNQPYGAILLFVFLIIKVLLIIKN